MPGVLYIGATGINLSGSVIITVVATMVALVIAGVVQRVRGGLETSTCNAA